MYAHIYPWGKGGLDAADLLTENGVDPAKIVICHSDVEPDLDYITALLRRGVFVEFDDFGKEFYVDPADRGFAGGIFVQDVERVRVVKQLVDSGYDRQLLITNDLCLKSMLHAYGGWGYEHILEHVVPMLRSHGVPPQAIDTILVDNPRRLLDVR